MPIVKMRDELRNRAGVMTLVGDATQGLHFGRFGGQLDGKEDLGHEARCWASFKAPLIMAVVC